LGGDAQTPPEGGTTNPAPPQGGTTNQCRLLPDSTPRPTSAVLVRLLDLAAWAELAPSSDIESAEAAWCGELVLLRGTLPPLPGERFWGSQLLFPAGFRPEPALPEAVLQRALGLPSDQVGLWTENGVEFIPVAAFSRLSRASIRLAMR